MKMKTNIPITKENVIFIKIFIILICVTFISIGIWGILKNNEEYKEYSQSNDIRQVDAKVIEVRERKNTHNATQVGMIKKFEKEYNYKFEYFIDNVKYITTLTESSSANKTIEPLKVGDVKKIVVFKDKDGNYRTSTINYQDLFTPSAKNKKVLNEISKESRDKNNVGFIFLIIFAVTIGSIMLWGLDNSINNSNPNYNINDDDQNYN